MTANLALANAYESGFKTQRIEAQVAPNYAQIPNAKPKLLTETIIEGVVIPEKGIASQGSN
jgi:hypothetical protein